MRQLKHFSLMMAAFAVLTFSTNSHAQPRISVDPEELDFEIVWIFDIAEMGLTISNEGNEDLIVEQITVEGECFSIDNEGDFILAGGEVTEISVMFEPERVDWYEGRLIITSNDPDFGETIVNLSGEGFEIIWWPPMPIDFGEVEIGERAEDIFVLENNDRQELLVADLFTEGECFGIEWDGEEIEIEPWGILEVPVFFEPEEVRDYAGLITVMTNDPDEAEFQLELFGIGIERRVPEIFIEPEELDFGEVWIGEVETHIVTISNEGGELLLVDEIAVEGEYFSVDNDGGFEVEPNELVEIVMIFAPEEMGDLQGRVLIGSNDPDNPEIEIMLQGRGNGAAIQVDPEVIDFGEVLINSLVRRELNIHNTGNAFLEVSDIFSSDEHFRVEVEPQEMDWEYIQTGQSMAVVVLSAEIDDEQLAVDDYIGVFTPGGVCAGYGQTVEFPLGINVYGDDPETQRIEGFREGERLEFRYWIADERREITVDAEYLDGENRFIRDEFSIVNLSVFNGFNPLELERPLFIEPEEHITVSVFFQPEEIGRLEEALIICSNSFFTPEMEVGLSGIGRNFDVPDPHLDPMSIDEDSGQIEVTDLDEVFIDPNGDELIFSFEGAPDELNMDIDEENVLFFDPEPNFNLPDGVDITITAEDPDGGLIDLIFSLVIEPVNDAPTWIDAPEEVRGRAGNPVEIIFVADDVDFQYEGDELILRMIDNDGTVDRGARFENNEDNTGTFTWHPEENDEGIYNLVFEVEDQVGASDEREVSLTILEPGRELTVPLITGWNIISINITPPEEMWIREEGPDVIRMMEQLRIDEDDHHVQLMKNEDGRFYLPGFDFNNIPYWDLTEGYQVKVDEDIEAVWTGDPIPADMDIPLERNWNLIAYYPTYELDASAPDNYVLSPIIDHVLMAKDNDGFFMVRAFNFCNMPPWRETQGYQVKVDADVVLNYPPEEEEVRAVRCPHLTGNTPPYPPPETRGGDQYRSLLCRGGNSQTALADALVCKLHHWEKPSPTDQNMSVLISGINGIDVSIGDQIGAFNSDGVLVGKGRVNEDGMCGIAVWGDDNITDEIEGLHEDEPFSLRFGNGELEIRLSVETIIQGEGLFYSKDSFIALEVKMDSDIPMDFELRGAFPNPFNSSTNVSYSLPLSSRVSIKVFDLSGRLVERLVNEIQPAGKYHIIWDGGSVSSGVYLVRMETFDFKDVRKVVLMR